MDLSGVDLRRANLSNANLPGMNLARALLSKATLTGVDLSEANLTGANLWTTNLTRANLAGANLTAANLTAANLTGANLTGANLTGANLWTTTLTGANLTGANLTRTNLMGAILIDTNLTQAILTDAYLYDANMVNADLSKSNLVGARLSGTNLAGANFRKANLGGIDFEQTHENLGKNVIEIKEGGNFSRVTSFDFKGDEHYLTTQSGILYEFKNGESTVVLDLNNDPKFPGKGPETGLLSVVSNNNFVYISYTIEGDDRQKIYLVVDEYSKTFNKNRTIIQIGIPEGIHNAGTLVFDNFGKMYLSVGDGGPQGDPENHAQDLNSLRGKILRLDVSKKNPKPEIVAYGVRNSWKISIDSKNRMFVGDCGDSRIESVYLIDDLYPKTPYNLGWPVFEGTERRKKDPLAFKNTLAPIYEYRHYNYIGVCVIGGLFLDQLEVYLFGDWSGIIRLLKEHHDGKWYEIHFQPTAMNIYSFGYDEETKKLFMGESSKIYELKIPSEHINLLPQVILCKTKMPNGKINNSEC
jgi:uncharacterized protein YjbI with pentapeptide repeats